ncbi:unnamed protein product [Strongylus vulgaris]|uniref:Uncharacterized protein n=1 Tax=Strongylus vulgaris TaxID=40348 RepID=A0A3P7IHF4_STRVU|nr:unnamed protein product [Strongylus vulgaris]
MGKIDAFYIPPPIPPPGYGYDPVPPVPYGLLIPPIPPVVLPIPVPVPVPAPSYDYGYGFARKREAGFAEKSGDLEKVKMPESTS